MVTTLFGLWLTFLPRWRILFRWKSIGKKPMTLSASSLGIIGDYTVYPRILSPIGILALRLGFKKISLNLLVLNPG